MEQIRKPSIKNDSEIIKFPEMIHQEGSICYIEKMIIGLLIMICRPKLIIETGTFHGQTTRFIAEFIKLNMLSPCRIATFDIPQVIDAIRQHDTWFHQHPEIEFISGVLPGTLERFIDSITQPVDFAIIDATHSCQAVQEELRLIHQNFKSGGYIFCHDYREDDPEYAGVVSAVNEFSVSYNCEKLAINAGGEIWGSAILRKPAK